MNVQWLRSQSGQITGLAVFFRKRGVVLAAANDEKAWRICDVCKRNSAKVYCREHTKYLCEDCLPEHTWDRASRCRSLLSVEAVRMLAGRLEVGWP